MTNCENDNTVKNDDFKYVIQDMNNVYLGRELTYAEMLDREDIPFKFKALINVHIQRDTDLGLKISEHLLQISREDFSYRIFEQLKLAVRICYKETKKGFGGRVKEKWIHKACPVKQFCEEYRAAAAEGSVQVEDVSISKLALMVISI